MIKNCLWELVTTVPEMENETCPSQRRRHWISLLIQQCHKGQLHFQLFWVTEDTRGCGRQGLGCGRGEVKPRRQIYKSAWHKAARYALFGKGTLLPALCRGAWWQHCDIIYWGKVSSSSLKGHRAMERIFSFYFYPNQPMCYYLQSKRKKSNPADKSTILQWRELPIPSPISKEEV